MWEVLPEVEQWLAAGERIALARVISVVGSAPRGLGATLALTESGGISGSVSGGCVEPAVIDEGLRAIRSGKPRLLTFGISEEQNLAQIGLSCGGEIRVFVERFEPSDVTTALVQALGREEPTVVATLVSAEATGPAMGPIGARIVLRSGSEGEEVFSSDFDQTRFKQLSLTMPATMLQHGDLVYGSTANSAGQTARYRSILPRAPRAPLRLVIVGAGHVSIPLTKLAKVLGYHVAVVDAREAFATPERFPEADEVLVDWPDDALGRMAITANTCIAVLTHDDKFDVPALVVALRSPAGYVGAIGSRSTRELREVRLREAGVTDAEISRIHGPIGLPIGAQTPEEIALSILAQIVGVRHRSPRRFVLDAHCLTGCRCCATLCRITRVTHRDLSGST